MTESNELRAIDKAKRALDRAVAAEHRARDRFESTLVTAAESGASQREMATVAGVSQPYVSQVLRRRQRQFTPSSPLGNRLASRRREVIETLERNGVQDPAVFGSVARGEDGPDSDIDLLVTIPNDMGLFGLARLEAELSKIVGVHVDVVPRRLLRDAVRPSAERDAIRL